MSGTQKTVFDMNQISKIEFNAVSSTSIDMRFYFTYSISVTMVIYSDNSFGNWKCVAASLFT